MILLHWFFPTAEYDFQIVWDLSLTSSWLYKIIKYHTYYEYLDRLGAAGWFVTSLGSSGSVRFGLDMGTTSLDSPGSVTPDYVRHSGVGHGPAGNVCLSAANSNDALTSRAALHLSATTVLRVGGFKEQQCTIWGVIVSIYIIIVQVKTVGSRATVIRVKDNEVDYLLTNLAPRIIFHSDMRPRHHPYMGHLKRMWCPVSCWPTGSRNASMVVVGGTPIRSETREGRMSFGFLFLVCYAPHS